MLKRYLLLFLGIGIIVMMGMTGSYIPPLYNSINSSMCSGYTPPLYNSINTTMGKEYSCITDTCSPSSPLTSNYEYDCSDNCIQSTNLDADGYNITLTGSGHFLLQANISNIDKRILGTGCEIWQEINSNFYYG